MAINSTLLCIHRDPAQLNLLQEHGYELVTATNGREGLRIFMSQPVDAIVLEYHLGILDGAVIADEIKQIRPMIPIIMLADPVNLPMRALKSVDALVARSDGPDSLLATVHSVLNAKPALRHEARGPAHLRGISSCWDGVERRRAILAQLAVDEEDVPFVPSVWRSIRNGTVQF